MFLTDKNSTMGLDTFKLNLVYEKKMKLLIKEMGSFFNLNQTRTRIVETLNKGDQGHIFDNGFNGNKIMKTQCDKSVLRGVIFPRYFSK